MAGHSKGVKILQHKNEIIRDILRNLWENPHDSKGYMDVLMTEALQSRSIKELKEING